MQYTITTRITDAHFNELVKRHSKGDQAATDILATADMNAYLEVRVSFPCKMPSAAFMARIAEGN